MAQSRNGPLGALLTFVFDVWSFLHYAFRRFINDNLSEAAGALTYSTLLALVPLLVIAVSILSGFPAFDAFLTQAELYVFSTLVPEVGDELRDYLVSFTHGAHGLPAIGTVALAITAVLLLSTIESTLNRVWRVEKTRPILLRILIFWAILTMGPLLLGASYTLTGQLFVTVREWGGTSWPITGPEYDIPWIGEIVAVLTQAVAFTILFTIVPARRVLVRHAAVGGLLSAVAFEVLRWGFNAFLTSGSTYETIYGAVAIIPLFLVWVYASWTVIILGAVVAAALPDWWQTRDPLLGVRLTPRRRLAIAVAILVTLERKAQRGGSVEQKALVDAVPIDARDDMLGILCELGYAVVTESGDISLARDLHTTTVGDLVQDLGLSLRGPGEVPPDQAKARVAEVFAKIRARTGRLSGIVEKLSNAEAEILNVPLSQIAAVHEAAAPPPTVLAAHPQSPRA